MRERQQAAGVEVGFALAALVASDRGARRAQAGLAPGCGDLCALALALDGLSAADRAQRLQALVAMNTGPRAQRAQRAAVARPAAEAMRNPRALSLLADDGAPGDRALLAAVGFPRAGYAPEPQLLQLLRRLDAPPEPRGAARAEASPRRGPSGDTVAPTPTGRRR